MAAHAVEREVAAGVVGRLGGLVVGQVAAHAVGLLADEPQLAGGGRRVAVLAVEPRVAAGERKPRYLVPAHHAGAVDEAARAVTLGALGAESASLENLVPERVIEGARHQMLHRVDRLERRLRAASRSRATEAVKDLAAVRAALMPDGQKQERRLNPVPMLARHGDLLLAQLKAGAAMHAGTLVGG